MKLISSVFCAYLFLGAVAVVFGQSDSQNSAANDKGITPSRVIGTITEIDSSNKCVTIQTASKNSVKVCSNETSSFYQMPINETSLAKAKKINFETIKTGDKSYAKGKVSSDLKTMPAEYIVIIEASEIEEKLKVDQEKWKKFGKTGFVKSIDAANKTIVVQTNSQSPEETLTIDVSPNTVKFLRYPPGKAKFNDAVSSSFTDIKVGDLLKVLLQNNSASNSNIAETVISGYFRTIGGTISAVNYEQGEIQVKDITSKETVTIKFDSTNPIKKMSPDLTNLMIAQTTSKKASPTPGTPDVNEIIEKLPATPLSELKKGDMLIISCSADSAQSNVLTSVLALAKAEQYFSFLQKQGLKTVPNLASMSFGQ